MNDWLLKKIATSLIVLLATPAGLSGSAAAQQPGNPQKESTVGFQATSSAARNDLPNAPEPNNSQAPVSDRQAEATQAEAGQPQNDAQKPVGTAVAPYERTVGVAASRPAGAAIAPGKQKRVRTIVITLGVVVGAGIAVGSVAALSHGSASRP